MANIYHRPGSVVRRDPEGVVLSSSMVWGQCGMPYAFSSGPSVCSSVSPNGRIGAREGQLEWICNGAEQGRFIGIVSVERPSYFACRDRGAIFKRSGTYENLSTVHVDASGLFYRNQSEQHARNAHCQQKAQGFRTILCCPRSFGSFQKGRESGAILDSLVSGPVSCTGYEFREDGSELEVRVLLPLIEDSGRQISAKDVAVNAQTTSLVVAVGTVHGTQILLNAGILYGSIRPSETVWFVDETEVVLSLKKANNELSWPELVESWASLSKGVTTLLKGSSVYIVGKSSEVNWVVAQTLAEGLEYVPLQTQRLIEQIKNVSLEELILGRASICELEGAVLKSLSHHVRCVVATVGGQDGAAAHVGGWNGLHAGFSVWLSQSEAQEKETTKDDVLNAKQLGDEAYSNADVEVGFSGWDSTSIRHTAELVLRALKDLLVADKDLPSKKSLYVRLGCRGDWPEIMPPGWDPERPQDEAKMAHSIAL